MSFIDIVDLADFWSRRKDTFKSWLPMIYMIAGLLLLRFTIVEPYVVPTGSMEPTLKEGDRLYALKCAYDIRLPYLSISFSPFDISVKDLILFRTGKVKRGDIILFRSPRDLSITYVKRAVGLPGDKIEFRQGAIFINGEEIAKADAPDSGVMYDIDHNFDKRLYLEQLGSVKHYVILDSRHDYAPGRNMEEKIIPEDRLLAIGDNRDNSYDSRMWGYVPMDNLKGKGMFIWYSSKDFVPRPERIGTLLQ